MEEELEGNTAEKLQLKRSEFHASCCVHKDSQFSRYRLLANLMQLEESEVVVKKVMNFLQISEHLIED